MNIETYTPLAGSGLESAILEARQLARSNGRAVILIFNEVRIPIPADGRRDEVILAAKSLYQQEVERKAEEWRNSTEGVQYCNLRRAQVKADREKMGALLANLAAFTSPSTTEVIRLLRDMAEVNDDIDVQASFPGWKSDVAAKLRSFGYRANTGVGDPAVKAMSDPRAVAHWIVGQALACLEEAMPIHPICVTFCNDWLLRWETVPASPKR